MNNIIYTDMKSRYSVEVFKKFNIYNKIKSLHYEKIHG